MNLKSRVQPHTRQVGFPKLATTLPTLNRIEPAGKLIRRSARNHDIPLYYGIIYDETESVTKRFYHTSVVTKLWSEKVLGTKS